MVQLSMLTSNNGFMGFSIPGFSSASRVSSHKCNVKSDLNQRLFKILHFLPGQFSIVPFFQMAHVESGRLLNALKLHHLVAHTANIFRNLAVLSLMYFDLH